MSNRTVVAVEPRGDETIEVKLMKAPVAFAGARIPQQFPCAAETMPLWSQNNAVKAHGRTIFDHLLTHQAINGAITDLLRIQPPQVRSLYFHLFAESAERLCWESLCDANGTFLALDKRWPIARMADSEVDLRATHGDFIPPLKVMAILSAVNRPAEPQWKHLRDAVVNARAGGFPVQLFIMTSEQDLLDEITQYAARDDNQQWLTVQPVPDRVPTLDRAIGEYRPHILHFYSHGSVSSGVSQLHLATILDWDDEAAKTGAVNVTLEALINFKGLANTWLITLNCCEGGKASNDLHSMAHRLVAGGIPAAVGMVEPINAADAHEFVEFFYPTLLDHLSEALQISKDTHHRVEFEWAPALQPPRAALGQSHGNPIAERVWTLPVMYVRPEAFELHYIDGTAAPRVPQVAPVLPLLADPAVRARIDAVAGALRALPPDTPSEARTELLRLLDDVPAEFRPARDGTVGGAV